MKKALWFLFSLKGRVSRVPFVVFILTCLGVIYISRFMEASDDLSMLPILTTLMVIILLIWPIFSVMTKRLHDISKKSLWALPVALSPAILIFFSIFYTMMGFLNPYPENEWLLSSPPFLFLGYISVLTVALALLPGTKGANRFGPSPKEKTVPIEATFE